MINVTRTFLPAQEEYNKILKRAWDANWITNRGVLVGELEEKLLKYLKVSKILLTTNGTLPLQIAIKALNLKGEIITTPFSYVATTSSIVWEGCTPVFVDIHPEYLTIDETKIEAAITPSTSAILATHVFGNPCAIVEIEKIARRHNLKVIYDAAHAFGVTYLGKSIFEYGDVSTCSFHATKLFHTGEGGAIFTNNRRLFDKIFYHHNFGHRGSTDFYGLGINAKMSELQAAMGLSVLPYIFKIMAERKRVCEQYDNCLNIPALGRMKIRENTIWNNSYYPILFKDENALLKAQVLLNKNDIFPRRYFYPSLERLPYIDSNTCPIAEDVSKRIVCLPLYVELSTSEVNKIIEILND